MYFSGFFKVNEGIKITTIDFSKIIEIFFPGKFSAVEI